LGFTSLDYLIVVLYLFGIAAFGLLTGGRQHSARDYFLGNKEIPWWAVCFAIVATETSALTFISIPGLAYAANLNFLQLTLGYLLGRIAVSILFLPAYFKGDLSTAYAFLHQRFGTRTRDAAALLFMGTRTLADGVRLFATAIPLAILLRGSALFAAVSHQEVYVISILIIAAITLLYTLIGGMRAVIWTDVVQMFIYLGGALAAAVILLEKIPGGFDAILSQEAVRGKLTIFSTGFERNLGDFFKTPYTFVPSVLGGAFLSMASHGTDQLIVQRLLTTRSLKGSQTALITSAVIVMVQFLLFLLIGILLYIFYRGQSMPSDEVFPRFIISEMPTGISGLIIAGLLAAAMSTLSGSINSLASSATLDFYKNYRANKARDAAAELRVSRLFSVGWGILLIASALFFMNTSRAVVELGLSIASFTYGALLGTFLLGLISSRATQAAALSGFAAGLVTMAAVGLFAQLAWTWYTVVGSAATLFVGIAVTLFTSKRG
jgi:SSS family solute:Na+ symporter